MPDPDESRNEDRLTGAFERVATTAERVGIPVATFAIGAVTIGLSTRVQIAVLPWVGAALILASLATYVWLTSRSTARVHSPPPTVPSELLDLIAWMRDEISKQGQWARDELTSQAHQEFEREREESR